MKAKNHGSHKWYIEPLDVRTNEVLAKNQEFLSDEMVCNGVGCEDQRSHRLWRCLDYSFVSQLLRSRKNWGLSFKIWHQDGNGQIREWNFPKKKVLPKMVHEKP